MLLPAVAFLATSIRSAIFGSRLSIDTYCSIPLSFNCNARSRRSFEKSVIKYWAHLGHPTLYTSRPPSSLSNSSSDVELQIGQSPGGGCICRSLQSVRQGTARACERASLCPAAPILHTRQWSRFRFRPRPSGDPHRHQSRRLRGDRRHAAFYSAFGTEFGSRHPNSAWTGAIPKYSIYLIEYCRLRRRSARFTRYVAKLSLHRRNSLIWPP